jgi:hypothetical protein
MTPEEALQLALSKLDECSIPYMVTGSFASNIKGSSRGLTFICDFANKGI